MLTAMYRIQWRRAALASLADISAYISGYNPHAGARVAVNIRAVVKEHIAFMPLAFPAPRADRPALRMCALPHPYIIYYRVDESRQTVTIIDIVHGARQSRRETHE